MLPAWSLVERWKSAVARYANRPAVDAVCYAELDSLANAVARRVLERSADPARPVGFRLPHDVSAVATALGILKAGRAYCAVDRTVPREVDLVLTEGPRQGAEEPELPPPNGACAVFTTSGSQGQARTVVRSQEAMLRRLDAYDQSVQPGPGDVMNLCYRLCFGASAVDLFGALCSGAALALHRLDLESLPAWLHRAGVSVFHLPAEAFRPWLDRGGSYPRLRRVIPSGRLYWSDLARLWPLVGADCQVISQYSCTETSTVALWNIDRRTPAGDGVVPVGHPLLAEFELHDEQGRPVAPGEVGEIVVRGYRTGDLARYDGILHLVGRRDNRVKIRGHRVELEAVDDALQQLPEVEASVTVAHEGRLVSYFVSRQDPPPAPEHLRNRLDLAVPPALLIPLKKLPRLENGKVDRQALPAPRPFLSKPSAGPTDPLQARLAHLWAEALGLDQVGVEDDFLELGGTLWRRPDY